MLINCKEVISSVNEDLTRKIECIGCQFSNNGEIIEGTIVFPRVRKKQEDSFEFLSAKEDTEIFTLYIPE